MIEWYLQKANDRTGITDGIEISWSPKKRTIHRKENTSCSSSSGIMRAYQTRLYLMNRTGKLKMETDKCRFAYQ